MYMYKSRGMYGDHAGASCFSPSVNIMRDPRWGRNQVWTIRGGFHEEWDCWNSRSMSVRHVKESSVQPKFVFCWSKLPSFESRSLLVSLCLASKISVYETLAEMTNKKTTLSTAEIWACLVVHTAIGKNAVDACESLQVQALETSDFKDIVFRGVRHFETGSSGISESRGKSPKCVKTSPCVVAPIKAIGGEDGQLNLQKIGERVDINSSAVPRVLRKDLGRRKHRRNEFHTFRVLKIRGWGWKIASNFLRSMTVATKNTLEKLWVMLWSGYTFWATPEVSEPDVGGQRGGSLKKLQGNQNQRRKRCTPRSPPQRGWSCRCHAKIKRAYQ